MKPFKWRPTLVASLGSVATVAVVFVHYAHAHRQGVPGGFLAIGLGALVVGLFVGASAHFSAAPERRSVYAGIVVGVLASLMTAGLLLVALISAFGS